MAMVSPVAIKKSRPILKARPQKNVNRDAMRKSIMERFPKIRAELAK